MKKENTVNEPTKAMPYDALLATVDLSWMWHCTDEPKNVLDYRELTNDKGIADAMNKAACMGFRTALRKLEDMGLIKMQDIDRSPKHFDQEKWDATFNGG